MNTRPSTPARTASRGLAWLLGAAAAGTLVLGAAPAPAQRPNQRPEIDIDQATLMADGYSFRKVVESGRHLFSTPYIPSEGLGEGPDGPRRSFQTLYDAPGFDYLRLNGLDSQSCFECHNSIGSARLFDTQSDALSRKVGVIGGPAGRASNAFINPNFPDQLVTFIRNPPHVFGTGYVQKLTEEMSLDLMAQRAAARVEAMNNPGMPVEQALSSKGTSFGNYRVTFTGTPRAGGDMKAALSRGGDGFLEDLSEVEGVSQDLVVRGLQWKGIASNERNFEKDALNFHFGIQPAELFFAEDTSMPGTVIVTDPDNDLDGVENEIMPGNVSAISVFTLAIRPPREVVDAGKEDIVARGRAIFTGAATDVVPSGTQMCFSCHTPAMRVDDSEATILDPTDISNLERVVGDKVGLSAQRASTYELPVARRFERIVDSLDEEVLLGRGEGVEEAIKLSARQGIGVGVGYRFDLTDMDSLPLSYPRLPENADGSIMVPLYSDLRRHDMGAGLADVAAQTVDVIGIQVPEREFLTRPLWGVADSGPWLHDGRAATLKDAILLHKSAGSEANEAITNFEGLSAEDQDAVIEFLLSLRLPVESAYDLGSPMGTTNISTRGQVGTGDFVMIAGFTISGSQRSVLITGKGPSLTDFGVPGALADPQIRLFSGSTQIDFNDNWMSAPNASAMTGLDNIPTDPNEAALLLTLQPGAYTIHLEGASDSTGQGLVEVWEQTQSSESRLLMTTGHAGFAVR